jgi:hypothetical protein
MGNRVLVCGSRDFSHAEEIWLQLDSYNVEFPIEVIIEGGALGADHYAKIWANDENIPVEEYRAEWKTYGTKAGPIRNEQMLTEGRPDIVMAFPSKRLSESKGTLHMVTIARKAHIPVIVYGPDDTNYRETND